MKKLLKVLLLVVALFSPLISEAQTKNSIAGEIECQLINGARDENDVYVVKSSELEFLTQNRVRACIRGLIEIRDYKEGRKNSNNKNLMYALNQVGNLLCVYGEKPKQYIVIFPEEIPNNFEVSVWECFKKEKQATRLVSKNPKPPFGFF